MRKKDIIRLCEKHNDCMFTAFTNGTLIDEAFADEMLRVKNFAPAISLEGFGEATDSRRGEGVYERVLRAMEILHQRKLIYGAPEKADLRHFLLLHQRQLRLHHL